MDFHLIVSKTLHLENTEVSILVAFIVMNLEKILSGVVCFLLFVWNWLLERQRLEDMKRENQMPAVLKAIA